MALSKGRREQLEQAKKNAKSKAEQQKKAQQTVKNTKSYTGNKVQQTVSGKKPSPTKATNTGAYKGNAVQNTVFGSKNKVTNSNVKQADKVTGKAAKTAKASNYATGSTSTKSGSYAARNHGNMTPKANRGTGKTYDEKGERQKAIDKLNANSMAWHNTTDTAERARLHRANDAIRKHFGMTYNGDTGATYLPKAGGGKTNVSEPVVRAARNVPFNTNFQTQADRDKRYDELNSEIDRMQRQYPYLVAKDMQNRNLGDKAAAAVSMLGTPRLIKAGIQGAQQYNNMSANNKKQADAMFQLYQRLNDEANALSRMDAGKAWGSGIANAALSATGAVENAGRYITSAGENALSGALKLAGAQNAGQFWEDVAKNTVNTSFSDAAMQKVNDWAQPVGAAKKAQELAGSGARMLPGMALGAATGTASKVSSLLDKAPLANASLAAIFGDSAASGTREALQDGANLNQALAYGAGSGLTEVGTEKMFGGIPGLNEGIAKLGSGNRVLDKAFDILGEGAEEAASTLVNPYLKRATYDRNAQNATAQELWDSAKGGMALAGIMQGASAAAERMANRRYGNAPANQTVTTPEQTAQENVQSVQPEITQPMQGNAQTAAQAASTDINPKLTRAGETQMNGGTAETYPFGQNTVGAAESAYTPTQKVSKVSSNTFTNSKIFNDAEKQSAKIFDQDGDALYDVVTENQSLDNARQRLDTDYDGEVRDLPSKPNFSGEDNDTAMGILSCKLEEARQSGDYSEVNKWAKLIKEKGTEGGQLVQSFAKYSRTPEGVIVQGQREIDAAVKLLQKTNPKQLAKWQKQGYFQWTDADAQRSADYMQQATDAGLDTQEGRTLEAKAMEVIAEKMPVTTKNKIVSLLMDNMLGNFRTLITRNAGGNAMFSAPEAICENFVAAPIDKLVSLKTKARTTYASPFAKSKAWAGGAKKGVSEMVSDIKSGVHTARSGETTSWQAQQKTFRDKGIGKIGNAYDSFVGSMLEAGDRPFYEAAFAAKMADLEKARSQGKLTKDFQGKDFDTYAPQVARQAALEAVFQNNGTVAQAFSNIATGLGKLSKGTLGTASLQQSALPFTKTPGNLVERAIEYSPFGMLKNAVQTGHEKRTGTFNQQRFVTETSRNIVGSAIFALAGSLVASGMLRGALPDDKDEAEALKNAGEQAYSIRIGDKNYSYSWIPVVGPALAGAADFYQTMNDMDGNKAAAVWNAAEGYLNSAIFEQSSLSSLPDLFGGSYGTPIEGIGKTFASLPSQMVPSLVRQAATATDPYERQTYVKGNTIESQLNSIKASIPWLRQTLPVKVDEQGNEKMNSQGRGLGSRLAENMILPYKVTQQQSNDVRDELMRLKKATGETTQFQNKITYAVEHDGEKKNLTAAESMQYQKIYGQESTKAIRELMASDTYKNLSDKEKVRAITEINSYAKTIADSNFVDIEMSEAEQKVKNAVDKGIGIGDYMVFKNSVKSIEDKNTGADDSGKKNMQDIVDLFENGSFAKLTDEQKDYLYSSTGRSLETNPYHISEVEKSASDSSYYKNLSGEDKLIFRSYANEYEDAVNNGKSLNGWVAKAKLASDNGVLEPYQFAAYEQALMYADKDENGSLKQSEVAAAINTISGLSQTQKAYLWQSQNKSWKPNKNPFGSATVYWPETKEKDNSVEAKVDKRIGGMQASQKTSSAGFVNPTTASNSVVTSGYGNRNSVKTSTGYSSSDHDGIDIGGTGGNLDGQAADSIGGGKVVEVGYQEKGYGNYVVVDHGNGYTSLYGHLQKATVKQGDSVSAGQQVGVIGSTGSSTAPHLHLRVHKDGQSIDPRTVIPGYGG